MYCKVQLSTISSTEFYVSPMKVQEYQVECTGAQMPWWLVLTLCHCCVHLRLQGYYRQFCVTVVYHLEGARCLPCLQPTGRVSGRLVHRAPVTFPADA